MSVERAPGFSVIVPTRNRPHQLETCIAAMTKLNYPRELFEVIVVDDGGDTGVESMVRQFAATINVVETRCEHAGPAAARNFGVARSSRAPTGSIPMEGSSRNSTSGSCSRPRAMCRRWRMPRE